MAQSRCFKTISTMKWIRTSRMSMKSSLSLRGPWLGVQGSAQPAARLSGRGSCGAGTSSSAVQYKPLGMARSLSYRGTSLITPPLPPRTQPIQYQRLCRAWADTPEQLRCERLGRIPPSFWNTSHSRMTSCPAE